MKRGISKPKRWCGIDGCDLPHAGNGLCRTHYGREKRRQAGLKDWRASEAKFWAAIEQLGEDDCWEWQRFRDRHGYGRTSAPWLLGHRTPTGAHRVSYMLAYGPIPEGLVLDHLCRNRACVNPRHLEAVTVLENTRRGLRPDGQPKIAERCLNGHEFTPENTRVRKNGRGRSCRACHREWQAQYLARRAS